MKQMKNNSLGNNSRTVRGNFMKICLLLIGIAFGIGTSAFAGEREKRVNLGMGLLYENGMDVTLGYEIENAYHHAWELFANGYLQWKTCGDCGHICPDSFWRNYRSWNLGAAYKPCVSRGKNRYGSFRLGGSLGSDSHQVIGGIHAGYEHNYRLRGGWQLYWQVKSDLMINGNDLFRTGIVLGIKLPVK